VVGRFHWKEMGDWQLNPECWPEPQAMVDELREMGIELMITFWPFMGMNESIHWDEYHNKGYLAVNNTDGAAKTMATGDSCGRDPKTGACTYTFWRYNTPTNNALVDSTNPAAMAQTTEHWFEGYGKYGVRAVWMDEAEPDHAKMISGGQWRLHAGTDTEVIPAWVQYWSKGFSQRFIDVHPDGEYFILSRNAWAGTSAHGTALWCVRPAYLSSPRSQPWRPRHSAVVRAPDTVHTYRLCSAEAVAAEAALWLAGREPGKEADGEPCGVPVVGPGISARIGASSRPR
jgi:alpha-D-xyloside xylohydrolase